MHTEHWQSSVLYPLGGIGPYGINVQDEYMSTSLEVGLAVRPVLATFTPL